MNLIRYSYFSFPKHLFPCLSTENSFITAHNTPIYNYVLQSESPRKNAVKIDVHILPQEWDQ